MVMTDVYVELDRHDTSVAGLLGDVSWVDGTSCIITTDDLDALMARLDADDNVLSYEEVKEGDGR